MNENNIARLFNYLKNNYYQLFNPPIQYSYICSSASYHYFIQYSFDKFKIKAVCKGDKSNVNIHKFSNCDDLVTLLRDAPFLKAVFANAVKQLSYYSYLLQNRIRCSDTNINDSFYMAVRTTFEKSKAKHSDYLTLQENTIVGTPLRFSAQNIFIDDRDRVERVQLSAQNLMTEQRVREIAYQTFRERIGELMERQNRIATDPRVEQSLRELRLRIEELSRRFDRRRNPEQR